MLGWKESGQIDADLQALEDLIFIQYGAIVEFDDLHEAERLLLIENHEGLEQILQQAAEINKVTTKIRIAWLRRPDLVACATKPIGSHGTRFIVLSIGTLNTLSKLYKKFLSNKNFFPIMGDSHLETDEKLIDLREIFDPSILEHTLLPTCEIRGRAAASFIKFALIFLTLHEYTHLTHAHLNENETTNDFDTIETSSARNLSDLIKSHTLEMDADSGAVVHICRILFEEIYGLNSWTTQNFAILSENGYTVIMNDCYGTCGTGPEGACRFFGYMIAPLFLLMHPRYDDLNNQTIFLTRHPHPAIRHFDNSVLFTDCLKRFNKNINRFELKKILNEGLIATYSIVDGSYKSRNNQQIYDIARSALEFSVTDDAARYRYERIMCWKKLYPIFTASKLTQNNLAVPTACETYEEFQKMWYAEPEA